MRASALQRLRDQKVRGAAIVGEQHGELEADLSISDLRHVSTKCVVICLRPHFCSAAPSRVIHSWRKHTHRASQGQLG